jgi:hypothetical protein
MIGRWRRIVLAAIALAFVLVYFRDPSWVGDVTSGLRPWEEDPPGTRFRWTYGRATFFVPSDAATVTVPMRSVFPGPGGGATEVALYVDDRFLTIVRLTDPSAWRRTTIPLGSKRASRRFRRIDLHLNRVTPPFMLGVMVGEVRTEP